MDRHNPALNKKTGSQKVRLRVRPAYPRPVNRRKTVSYGYQRQADRPDDTKNETEVRQSNDDDIDDLKADTSTEL